jgi:hypothetical protein
LLAPPPPPVYAQEFKPAKFDQSLIQETLRDQDILREEMLLEQEILREEMEQIRIEIQRIMKEIALSMKEEALKLKAELEGLQLETKVIQQEILGILEKSKKDFAAGKEEMQKELEKMRTEAKVLTKDIKQVLQDQKAIWKQETVGLQNSLLEARKEMNSAKVDSKEILQTSRSALGAIKQESDLTLADSQAQSNSAMLDAKNSLKKSQKDYQKNSKSVTQELMANMKEARESMQSRQNAQRKDSKNAQREVLAALETTKNKRIAELRHDATQQRTQNKNDARSSIKQSRKQSRVKNVEKRQALLRDSKSKVLDIKNNKKRTTQNQKTREKSIGKANSVKKRVAHRKASQKDSLLQGSRDRQKNKIIVESTEVLDKNFNRTFGETGLKENQKKVESEELLEDQTELVVASLPDTTSNTPEKTLQDKLSQFSKNITDLKIQIQNSQGDPEILFIKLGDAYLDAQRFMDAQQDTLERKNLLDFSEDKKLLLGSYEQATWAYKLALKFNQKSADTHLKIGKIYDEMQDGKNALMYVKLAHQIFKTAHKSSEVKETLAFIESLTSKYNNISDKITVHKG